MKVITAEEQLHLECLKENPQYINHIVGYIEQRMKYDSERGEAFTKQVLSICQEKGYKQGEAEALLYLGWYAHDHNHLQKALEYHTKAQDLFKQYNNAHGLCKTYNALLSTYMDLGEIEHAIQTGIQGIELAEAIKDEKLLTTLILNTSMAYIVFDNIEDVRELFERLEKLHYSMEPFEHIYKHMILSQVLLKEGDYETAYTEIQKALSLCHKQRVDYVYGEVLYYKGRILYWKGLYDEAIEILEEAVEVSDKASQPLLKGMISKYQGKCYEDLRQEERAKGYYLRGIQLLLEIGAKYELKKIYKDLSRLYKKLGCYKEAFEALEASSKYNHEVITVNSKIAFERLKNTWMRYQVDTYESLYYKLEQISKAGNKLTSNLNSTQMLDVLYEELQSLIQADDFGIGYYNEADQSLQFDLLIQGNKKVHLDKIYTCNENTISGYCIKHKKDIIINDLEKEYDKYVKAYQNIKSTEEKEIHTAQSLLYCPLCIEEKMVGMISAQSYKKHAFNMNDLNTLKIFASYAAIAIWNAQLFEQINYLAKYDVLTDLHNRRETLKLGEKLYCEAKSKETGFAILMIDLDLFKKINDRYGHPTGDDVLKKSAEIIKACLINEEVAGRYGGEEFIVFLPGVTQKQAVEKAEKIRLAVYKGVYRSRKGERVQVTTSVGVYYFKGYNIDFYQGIEYADHALYDAKNQGKNKVCYWKE